MKRNVSTHLEANVAGLTQIVLSIAPSAEYPLQGDLLHAAVDGWVLDVELVESVHGARLHMIRNVGPGHLVIDYEAIVDGVASAPPATELEWFRYTRPSRYCESDLLAPVAQAEFAGLQGADLLFAVSSWVGSHIRYRGGSSRSTDGAVATLLGREGVCRDFAHLTAALLRANGVAARVVSVYAPGLQPMDFHAVAEASLDGVWHVVDPTCLAPRDSMVRIATGADATDTAFLSNVGGAVDLEAMWVTATVDPFLPGDDLSRLVRLQ